MIVEIIIFSSLNYKEEKEEAKEKGRKGNRERKRKEKRNEERVDGGKWERRQRIKFYFFKFCQSLMQEGYIGL